MAKVSIDSEKCIGCGSCCSLCPKTFKMKGEKAVVIKKEVKDPAECEKEAASICAVGAITITD